MMPAVVIDDDLTGAHEFEWGNATTTIFQNGSRKQKETTAKNNT